MSELTCPNCHAENPSENTFCGTCGARLHPESVSDLVSLVDRAVDKQMAAALESRLKDQSVVEVEIAEKIAERTMKWAKLAGFFIGIPVTLLIGVLAFLGIKTYSDLDNLVNRLDQTRDQIASAQTAAQNAKLEAEELLKQTQEQESNLHNQVVAVRGRLSNLEQELRSAEDRIQQRQDRLEETVQDLIAGRISLGTKDSELSELFSQYLQYLDDIGFRKSEHPVSVTLSDDPQHENNVFYLEETHEIIIGRNFASDKAIALRSYMHHVLLYLEHEGETPYVAHYAAIETAVADYFPSSFLDNPKVGEAAAATFSSGQGYIRNLDNELTYDDYLRLLAAGQESYHAAAEVWGGLFWNVRAVLSRRLADRVIFTTWRNVDRSKRDLDLVTEFSATLYTSAVASAGVDSPAVKAIWSRRGFPTNTP